MRRAWKLDVPLGVVDSDDQITRFAAKALVTMIGVAVKRPEGSEMLRAPDQRSGGADPVHYTLVRKIVPPSTPLAERQALPVQ